jgi:hypothetical protein
MIFETLAIAGVLLGLGTIACLSLSAIRGWLRNRAATRYGDLIKHELQNGNVEIVAIGLTAGGSQTGQKTWTAKSLDPELAAAFGYSDRTRITV